MGNRNKSRRFVQQGKDTVTKHDERFPYHTTLSEAEARNANKAIDTLGGI
ncbi:hypothetical protein [uncultured Metabacillus sp.]|nr:hypothetical protein [uncultured Metabacillus sp.]